MKQYPYLLRILSFSLLAGLIPLAHTQDPRAGATKHGNARFFELHASFLKRAASVPAGVVSLGDSISHVKPSKRWAFQTIRQDRNDSNGDLRSLETLFEAAKENIPAFMSQKTSDLWNSTIKPIALIYLTCQNMYA